MLVRKAYRAERAERLYQRIASLKDELNEVRELRAKVAGLLTEGVHERSTAEPLLPIFPILAANFSASSFPSGLPASGFVSASFRELSPFFTAPHRGIDIALPEGGFVRATAAGVILFAGYHPIYGKLVEIDHRNGYTTRYAHLFRITVSEGEEVMRGSVIGLAGSTGRAFGSHIHYELLFNGRVIDPLSRRQN